MWHGYTCYCSSFKRGFEVFKPYKPTPGSKFKPYSTSYACIVYRRLGELGGMVQLLMHFFVNQIDKRYHDEQIVKYSLNMDSCRWDRLLENFSNYGHVNRFGVSVVIFIQNIVKQTV